MQECNITLRLNGSLQHTIAKEHVTPAEIQVLRALHGQDAVVDVIPTKMTKRGHRQEFDRLSELYGRANGGDGLNSNDPTKNLVASLFPGANPVLPIHLKDIGMGSALREVAKEPENVED